MSSNLIARSNRVPAAGIGRVASGHAVLIPVPVDDLLAAYKLD